MDKFLYELAHIIKAWELSTTNSRDWYIEKIRILIQEEIGEFMLSGFWLAAIEDVLMDFGFTDTAAKDVRDRIEKRASERNYISLSIMKQKGTSLCQEPPNLAKVYSHTTSAIMPPEEPAAQ